MTTVTGRFETRIEAEAAAQALIQRGYPAHLIQVSAEEGDYCDSHPVPLPNNDCLAAVSPYLSLHAVVGALLGSLFLGGIAVFYFSIDYLHLAWVFAMFGVGAYVGLLSGTLIPSKKIETRGSTLSALSFAPAVLKIDTTPHQSLLLGHDLKRAGATQINSIYTV